MKKVLSILAIVSLFSFNLFAVESTGSCEAGNSKSRASSKDLGEKDAPAPAAAQESGAVGV